MKLWEKVLISDTMPILDAIKIIDISALQIALVVDEERHLLGTVTDGDVRRCILKGKSLVQPVKEIMNTKPTIAFTNTSRDKVLGIMKLTGLRQIPIVDMQGRVINLESIVEILQVKERDNWVMIMAGGLGSRLKPLTDDCPKPLLKVGDRPILETILENFMEYGFKKFFISVNYRAEMIEHYFGNGARWGAKIHYIHERERLGTAGALSLLPQKLEQPILVMNGDLLTKVNFKQLLEFHEDHSAMATMCVREYDLQVPYGVVKTEHHRLIGIDEKPVQRFFVNAGIYVLEPEMLDLVPKNELVDMPHLFEKIMEKNHESVVFPIREYWADIGHMADFERANLDFIEVFT